MLLKDMKAAVERANAELWNKKNYAVIGEIYAEDVRLSTWPPGFPQGHEGMRVFANTWLTAIPDFEVTILDMVAENNKVMSHWSVKGTWENPIEAYLPATGKVIKWQGVTIERFANDKIVEIWLYGNLFDQLGAAEFIQAAHQGAAT